ncbi:hypothetical protein Halru_0162 [Halovivax ruber XH-70]|uniref:DUF7978 domain-containing protein n=1 Tax=Halovivax ruber (strain DSM 18193 / JCM 13892 / XH-70) TaxID=797302 RepID=L0I813_HALRX|nr:hypothetical protein [Halovivax ruber]AGB14814.1 hypothetical protein Halru_0162 [Halovivax ruber XH-70]
MSRTAGSTDGGRIAASAGVGVLVAAIGYLLTTLLIRDEVKENLENFAEWKGTAWYYFNAHFVELERSGSVGGISGTDTINLISESGSANADLLYVIPPVVLLFAGALLAYRLDVRDLGGAVVTGAPVALGYSVVMSLGALVTESSSQGAVFGVEWGGSMAPVLLPAVVLAGILYPLVFATAGAVITSALR